MKEGERPDRPDPHVAEKIGLTDPIWAILEAAWKADHRARPTFPQLVRAFPENGGAPLPTSSSSLGMSTEQINPFNPLTTHSPRYVFYVTLAATGWR